MTELLYLAPTAVLAYLLWQAGKRYDDVQQAFNEEREGWAKERRELLNRIQAPEVEVAKQWDVTEPAHLPWDDDEAFNTYQETAR